MRYSTEPRGKIYVKGYGFLSFAKNMGRHANKVAKNMGRHANKVAKNLSNK